VVRERATVENQEALKTAEDESAAARVARPSAEAELLSPWKKNKQRELSVTIEIQRHLKDGNHFEMGSIANGAQRSGP